MRRIAFFHRIHGLGLLVAAAWLLAAAMPPARGATPIALELIDGSDRAPYSAVGQVSGALADASDAVTFAVVAESGLVYGVQFYPGTLDGAVLTLTMSGATTGTVLSVADSAGLKHWFFCTAGGTLHANVSATTGSLGGDFAVRVLRTSAVTVSGSANDDEGDAWAGIDVRCVPSGNAYGDGAWAIDAAPAGATRSNGSYSLTVPAGWSGDVVAGSAVFPVQQLPLAHSFVNLRDDLPVQNYDFTTTTLRGKVALAGNGSPLSGARITASQDGHTTSTLTGTDGKWSIVVPLGWIGTLSASIVTSSTQFSFDPAEIDVQAADWGTTQTYVSYNFGASPLVRLSGTLKLDSSSVPAPVGGVSVYLSDGTTAQTRPDGTFRFYVESGWSGFVYANGLAGVYYPAPVAVAVSQVTEDKQLTAIVLKQYATLDTYYDVYLNAMTPATNPAQFRITTDTIAVLNVDPATDMLKIRKKTPPSGEKLDYPPIGAVLVAADGGSGTGGGLKSFYTEGAVGRLALDGNLAKVSAVGTYIAQIEIGGVLGPVTMSNSKGNCPVAAIVAYGAPGAMAAKPAISLSGVTLGGLYAPGLDFGAVKSAGKKVAAVTNAPSIWLPGGIAAAGYWDAALERDFLNGKLARRSVAIGVRSAASLTATGGAIAIESLAGAVPKIAATGNRDVDATVLVGWMDNTATGKVAVTTKGGDLALLGPSLVAGGVSTLSARAVYFRSGVKGDTALYRNGGELRTGMLATGLAVTDLTLATERAKATIGSIVSNVDAEVGAAVAGASYDRLKGIVTPGYFGVTSKVTVGQGYGVAGSFYGNGYKTRSKLPTFVPALTTAQAADVWIEIPPLDFAPASASAKCEP